MLADLRIENLAVVEGVRASFAPGLNVISGETGAGKTILLEALSLSLGGRASSDLVRSGTDSALVEARFVLSGAAAGRVAQRLRQLELPGDGDELVVRRTITREGKSRVYINDASATVGGLATIAEDLVELTGQHDQFGLLRGARHLALLDAFAGTDGLAAEVATAVSDLRATERRCSELEHALSHRSERDEFLQFYLREFERLKPEPGEDETLAAEANRLRHAEKLRTGLVGAIDGIYEGRDSAYDRLAAARRALEPLISADGRLEQALVAIDQAQSQIADLSRQLGNYVADAVDEPERLAELESRLHELQRLCRKHGGDLTTVVAKMEGARQELAQLGDLEHAIGKARAAFETKRNQTVARAAELSQRRRTAVAPLEEATAAQLRDLGFLQARFEIELTTDPDPARLGESGADQARFLLSTNPGQAARPLAKVASGGELSRTLLALKCALAAADTAPIQVLDEIDSGIGGATAEIVGRKIRELANQSQVLCVTHLPQIASFADHHLVVLKVADGQGTRTILRALAADDRVAEVARMLGGMEITATTLEHAREMLGRAGVETPARAASIASPAEGRWAEGAG